MRPMIVLLAVATGAAAAEPLLPAGYAAWEMTTAIPLDHPVDCRSCATAKHHYGAENRNAEFRDGVYFPRFGKK